MAQKQTSSQSSSREETQAEETVTAAQGSSVSSAGLDGLLDEIDTVLESNAEEFVKGFVQKGGQ